MKFFIVWITLVRKILTQISIPYTIILDIIQVNVKFADINFEYFKNLEMQKNVTFFFPNAYISKSSDPLEQTKIFFKGDFINMTLFEEKIHLFKKTNIKRKELSFNMKFYLLEKFPQPQGEFTEGLTVSYEPDKEHSFIYQLYYLKEISKLSFCIEPLNYNTGLIHLGEVDKSVLKKHNFFSSCKASKKYGQWSCYIDEISFQKHTIFPATRLVKFNPAVSGYIFPKNLFLSWMRDYLFFNECEEFKLKTKRLLRCKESKINEIKNITFVLEKTSFVIPSEKLFHCKSGDCISIAETRISEEEEMVFGTAFLTQFLTVFNYEEGTINFFTRNYEQASMDTEINKNFNTLKSIFLFITGITTLMIFILWWKKRKELYPS